MGANGDAGGDIADPDPLADFQWDSVAEAELLAIEASYYTSASTSSSSKRSISGSDPETDQSLPSKCRRLPDWTRPYNGSRSSSVLWDLAPAPCRVNYRMRYPAMKFRGQIVYCRTLIEVERATIELLGKINAKKGIDPVPVPLGFDIEWRPVFRRRETQRKAAVMQICMDDKNCYVMQIIHSGIPSILKSLLEDSSSIKVGICIDNDACKISKDYDVRVEPLADLSSLANLKLVGPSRKWSLSSLTETVTCKELEKPNKIRKGNWEAEFLSGEQLQYAATDAFASWYLYEVLKAMPDPKIEKENME